MNSNIEGASVISEGRDCQVEIMQPGWHICLSISFPELTLNPPEGIIAGPTNEENFFEWEALIV